jgi:hypothetical protein
MGDASKQSSSYTFLFKLEHDSILSRYGLRTHCWIRSHARPTIDLSRFPITVDIMSLLPALSSNIPGSRIWTANQWLQIWPKELLFKASLCWSLVSQFSVSTVNGRNEVCTLASGNSPTVICRSSSLSYWYSLLQNQRMCAVLAWLLACLKCWIGSFSKKQLHTNHANYHFYRNPV